MSQTLEEALNSTTLYSDDIEYVYLQLPANAVVLAAGIVAETNIPFCGLLVDKDEVTLMLPEDAYDQFSKRLSSATLSETRYRLLTFDIELEPTLIGFMAKVSAILAENNIPIFPFAAFSRDHIFVPMEHFDKAQSALQQLIEANH